MTFQIKDTDVAYVNTLRRMILTGVETLAFNSKMNDQGTTTDVKILTNTTPMTNEMLADRIGLIPITIPKLPWSPDTWNRDAFEFRLSVENTTGNSLNVKAEDIQVFQMGRADEGYLPYATGNREFFHPDPVSHDTCLIAVLKAKQPNQAAQKIEFVARASVGTGQQHIRWSPVSQCSYAYTIDTNPEKQQLYFQRWLENSKKLSLDSLDSEPGKKEAMIREFQTMEVQRCYKTNEKGEPNSFDFIVEAIGTLPISTIVERALFNIEKKLAKYAGELPNDVKVLPADNRSKAFDFYFPNEDHTLGNLLQAYMEANQMDSNQISFVGYKVPHPLRAEMVVRVGVDFPTDKTRDGKQTVARAAISQAAAGCALMFKQWREDWNRALAGTIGTRNRESLRLNVGNARALEEAAARGKPAAAAKPAPGAKRTPQKSAFYDKLRPTLEADPSRAIAPPVPVATTPNYGAAPGTPNYGAAAAGPQSPNYAGYAPLSPVYAPGTPNYGAAGAAGSTTPGYAPTSPVYPPRSPE